MGWLKNFGNNIRNFFNNMAISVIDIISSLSNIIEIFNPSSETFFLKVAFVPSTVFMESFTNDIKISAENKFGFMTQFKDTWESVKNIQDVTMWEGISYNNPIIGEVTILSPIAINAWGPKIKYWIGGFMILLTVVLTFRRIGGVIGGNLH